MFDIVTSQCFVAGTLVLTEDGEKPIEEIEVGDYVYASDPETGESDYKEVLQTFINETSELVHIYVNNDEIVSTPTHPFYSPKRGWTNAVDLKAGDILVLSNGEYVIVEQIQHEILEAPVKVYNFEVQDFHTYYVGKNSVLVHNECKGNWSKGSGSSPADNSYKHYKKHGTEVGAKGYEDYLRKAKNFGKTVLNKKIKGVYVPGYTDGVFRYRYNGKYIDMVYDGFEHLIVSYGLNKRGLY